MIPITSSGLDKPTFRLMNSILNEKIHCSLNKTDRPSRMDDIYRIANMVKYNNL